MTAPARPVPGYEGLYEVSDQGRVVSFHQRAPRVLRPAVTAKGYCMVTLVRGGVRRTISVHRVVAAAFLGPCPPGMEVRHRNGDPGNNSCQNLAYGTHGENMRDRTEHGNCREAERTRCPQDHPYDDVNTYWYGRKRQCRVCRRLSNRRAAARRRALVRS